MNLLHGSHSPSGMLTRFAMDLLLCGCSAIVLGENAAPQRYEGDRGLLAEGDFDAFVGGAAHLGAVVAL